MGWMAGKIINLLDGKDVLDNHSEMSIAKDNWLIVESSVVLTISLPGQVQLDTLKIFLFSHVPVYLRVVEEDSMSRGMCWGGQ